MPPAGVDRSARSTAGSFPPDVHTERSSGAAGDVYRSFFPPNHTLIFDGDGLEGGGPGSDGLGLDGSAGPLDDLVGLEMCAVGAVDPDLDGVLDQPVYFTLAAGSPTLATLGATPHDVLRSRIGASGAATLWLAGSALGLVGVTGVPLAVVARSVLVAVLLARIGVERTVVTPVRMGVVVVVGCGAWTEWCGAGWP